VRDQGTGLFIDVFIDGFNLEFGAMRPTGLHWIDLRRLAGRILPQRYGEVGGVFLYTAPLLDRDGCVGVATKQGMWFRALTATKAAQVVLGHHVRQLRSLPRIERDGTEGPPVKVVQTIEQGSDVNLAVDLVDRAHRRCFGAAAVVSNDGDLGRAVELVSRDLSIPVVVINPQPGRQSRGLAKVATEIRTVRPTDLARSQLPDRIETATDFIYKPDAWWRGERG